MSGPEELGDQLLEAGFRRYDGVFAGGQQANNKTELDYETLLRHPQLLNQVVELICEKAEPYKPDFFAGVPDGATGLAERVAQETGAYFVRLKRPSKTEMSYATTADRDRVGCLQGGILLEDVLNRRTNTKRALDIEGLGPKILAVIGILDRSIPEPEDRKTIGKPVHSLVRRPIAPILPDDDELWRFAS